MYSGYAILAACALMAAVGVHAAPADPAAAKQFAALPFAPSKFSPEGFPLNEKGDEFHLIQKDANQAPVWMPESQVWDLKKKDSEFMDVTFQPNLADKAEETRRSQVRKGSNLVAEPAGTLTHTKEAKPIVDSCNTTLMKSALGKLVTFKNRYYRSPTGTESANWLFGTVQGLAKNAKDGVKINVTQFKHRFNQPSVIARIEGEAGQVETVIVGAHQDSINGDNPLNGVAPGADDDGSGTVSILEAFRAIVDSGFKPKRPIEFHWYAGEEAGLLGSQDVAASYQRAGRKVAGMLQMDMTGTPANGRPNEIGMISDNVNSDLTQTVEKLVGQFVPDVTSKRFRCGYGCSDHASWTKAGYKSAFPFESAGLHDNDNIHTTEDTIEKVSFDHAVRFSKIAVGFAVELSLQ
ncbi:aminopeptidase [Syncephalis fuscata]|nr:aminopeptidase [Syncephalis fuscata]